MAYVKTEAYVKPENMAEHNEISNLTGAIPNGTPLPYTWSDQSEKGYQQHMMPQKTT